ncbi:hypothetical protein LX36DRAFT_715049 [Colletotrichum falcatum]|nr:hypothetical protein LX36DRAFT_715049 [Colletotrichum falcatum]
MPGSDRAAEPAGSRRGTPRPLPCDIHVDHDVAITTRDGTVLYADVLRPPGTDDKVPAIICRSGCLWGMTLSGLGKFEAPDPADWVPRGYAVVNVDTRGRVRQRRHHGRAGRAAAGPRASAACWSGAPLANAWWDDKETRQ